jgi:uncharacterized membrane protein YGL010W
VLTAMTFVFAGFALTGGVLGAMITKAPLPVALISVAVGFAMMCLAEVLGLQNEPLLTLLFMVVSAAVAFFMKLGLKQIIGVVLGAYIGSLFGHFVIAFIPAFYDGLAESAASRN